MPNMIIGHQNIITQLKNAVTSERVAGAYLFSGEQGIGKETVALYFANLILCESPTDVTSCGECRACRKIKNGNHPDLRIIRPDGAQIKIDQIRHLQQQIVYQPLEGERKIYIIANTEKMNDSAANSLLKTLEEPPASSTIILLTENLKTMLPTIRSRCQILTFYPMPTEELSDALLDRFSIDTDGASAAAVLSQGVVGKAITLIDKGIRDSGTIPEIMAETNLLAAFRLAEEFENEQERLDDLITWYRDLMLVQQDAPKEYLTHTDALEQLQTLVSHYSINRIQRAIKTIFQTKTLLQTNVSKIFALEVMCIKLIQGR
ncbi:MAG: DNA polymerase III subunit delta' [Candidatus Poribacteria bacterium]|nr:DNA polymerase III subunit delta' [Candidatus Poribacteria bacterium]